MLAFHGLAQVFQVGITFLKLSQLTFTNFSNVVGTQATNAVPLRKRLPAPSAEKEASGQERLFGLNATDLKQNVLFSSFKMNQYVMDSEYSVL